MDKREFVNHIKDILELDDFKAVGVGAGSVSLVREKEEIIISYNKYLGEFILPPAIGCRKCFDEVENILEKYFVKQGLGYGRNTIHHSSRREEDLDKRTIVNSEDFNKILPELHAMIYDDILPFFEKYQTLENVHNQLNTFGNDFGLVNKLLSNPQPIRRIIINKLCGDGDWKEKALAVQASFDEASKSGQYKEMYSSYAQIVEELIEELEAMPSTHPA
jgi:hypothetical protein